MSLINQKKIQFQISTVAGEKIPKKGPQFIGKKRKIKVFGLRSFQLNLFWFQKKIFHSDFGSFEKSVTFGPSQPTARAVLQIYNKIV